MTTTACVWLLLVAQPAPAAHDADALDRLWADDLTVAVPAMPVSTTKRLDGDPNVEGSIEAVSGPS
jgi:hypothetical protein